MRPITLVAVLGLLCSACGGGIDSYEDGMEAQADVMEEMMDVLEDVTDQESAQEAVPEIEALGERLAEIAAQMAELPQPEMEELQEMAEAHSERSQESQERMTTQLMKLGEYPELIDAFTRAMAEAR